MTVNDQISAKRAFALEDKDERRRLILATAAQLFVEGDGSLPSAEKIAHASGLAKGTVYLYFSSKGSIFSTLQAEGWRGLRDTVDAATGAVSDSHEETVATLIAGLVEYFRRHPELMRLDALSCGAIEPGMATDELASFKLNQMNELAVSATKLDVTLGLTKGRSLTVMLRSHALVRGLWQTFPSPKHSAATVSADNEFYDNLSEALHEYWRGALQV